ncbi:MAG: NADPH-adrenodoxin reductase [Alyxoria varia]|nr:MAG: NADPH-adrenodoxin reductase [Alyxoria varia]
MSTLGIIGSGPAGFYAALRVLKNLGNAQVDMYEQLPVPYGLVRFGVAPDHPEVKNCQDRFEQVASSPRFQFIGNTKIGEDVPLSLLRKHYDALLFAYGASQDRLLGIPGEDLKGVYSARQFVGWYNGLPEFAGLKPVLDSGDHAVVIGHGNVAIDVARILLSDVDSLRKTDISEEALDALSSSKIRRVTIAGRRGPFQSSFTVAEVRELVNMASIDFRMENPELLPSYAYIRSIDRVNRIRHRGMRLAELLVKQASIKSPEQSKPESGTRKSISLKSLVSPIAFESDEDLDRTAGPESRKLSRVLFQENRFKDNHTYSHQNKVEPIPDKPPIAVPATLAFRSIGYKAVSVPGLRQELGIGFDEGKGTMMNDGAGRAFSSPETIEASAAVGKTSRRRQSKTNVIPGCYCTGWVKSGPTGVIVTTMHDAFEAADAIVKDWEMRNPFLHGTDTDSPRHGWDALREEAGLDRPWVSWDAWRRIDATEKYRGQAAGKERSKITDLKGMLEAGRFYDTKPPGQEVSNPKSDPSNSVLLLERHPHPGTETSSRNSEVIHAGLYYGPNTLKTKLCLRGKRMLYHYCEQKGVMLSRCGKLVVAQSAEQKDYLKTKLFNFADHVNAGGEGEEEKGNLPLEWHEPAEVGRMEPDVRAEFGALESTSTGIIDSHGFMVALLGDFEDAGGTSAFASAVTKIERAEGGDNGWRIFARSSQAEDDKQSDADPVPITTNILINSAGLAAIPLSNSILPQPRHIQPAYAKGTYYSYSASQPHTSRLIYPAPSSSAAPGLGTHLTMDLTGRVRFGPDVEWIDDPSDLAPNKDPGKYHAAVEEIKSYLPNVKEDCIDIDYCGIRPKLGRNAGVGTDFYIKDEGRGHDDTKDFINLLGMESPGLTSSLAIGDYVRNMAQKNR